MLDLMASPYSPWSEKARWALDHHDLLYREQEYHPLLGEPALRARLRDWRGRVSIPILFTEDAAIRDSLLIARYAEHVGASEVLLFPAAHEREIAAWNDRSEIALAAGRALVSKRVLDDPAAKREALPPMPVALRGVMTPLANLGVAFLKRKYSYTLNDEEHRTHYAQILESLQEALSDGRHYLLGDAFSYADICMAVTLQSVRPVTDDFIKLGPASRRAWTDDLLAARFASLLKWRDQVYASSRIRRPFAEA